MHIPFNDLYGHHKPYLQLFSESFIKVINSSAFANSTFVENFEHDFAQFCECKFAVGVGSGTEALWLTLVAADIGPGDEVITAANSFVATAEAIRMCQAVPVVVDALPGFYTMCPHSFEKAITSRTKAVIPVHLYGQPADMDQILRIAHKYGLIVIEDACQAHGAKHNGKAVGGLGLAGCFSFYPGKNLGAFGEAGIVVTNSEQLADRIRKLRDHGQTQRYVHDINGWNARMDGIQAAILSVKLPYLHQWNEKRQGAALLYNKLLEDIEEVETPSKAPYADHVYHIYCIQAKNRDNLKHFLANNRIETGIHYPIPIHKQKCSQNIMDAHIPYVDMLSNNILSLPIYPHITTSQIKCVCENIRYFYDI